MNYKEFCEIIQNTPVKRNGFMLRIEVLQLIPLIENDSECLEFLMACILYGIYGLEYPEFKGLSSKYAMTFAKQSLNKACMTYDTKVENGRKHKANKQSGVNPEKEHLQNNEPKATETNRNKPKATENNLDEPRITENNLNETIVSEIEEIRNKKLEIGNRKLEIGNIEIRNTYDNDYLLLINKYTNNDELRNGLIAFKEMKQKQNTLTLKAFELNLNNLSELANNESEKIEIVNNTIRNGWRSFYPLKKNQNKKAIPDYGNDPATDGVSKEELIAKFKKVNNIKEDYNE